MYIKVKLKGNIRSFLALCQWIEAKDTVRYPTKARSWLQEAITSPGVD